MTSKKIISLGVLLIGVLAFPAFGMNVTMQPLYTDARFQPVDAFHAGCDQDTQFSWEGTDKNVSEIHLVMRYNPADITISRVVNSDTTPADYKIEYDTVTFDISNPTLSAQSTPLFNISFKSSTGVTSSEWLIDTWSYAVSNGKHISLNETLPMAFAQVPECDPDVIAPSVSLVYPKDPTARVSLDQSFVFEIKDTGKGIDPSSVQILLDGQLYTADMVNLQRKGDYLTFYPQNWLGVNKKINLKISIGDKQVYGWPNTTDESFQFQTATGLVLEDNIDPMTLRKMARWASKLFGSSEECTALQGFYVSSDVGLQGTVTSIMQKLACDTGDLAGLVPSTDTHGAAPDQTKGLTFVSVFAALGRILFGIALILKFHYMASYKKHKRLAELYKKN